MKVLVTGATGYIGGRLIPRLLDRDHKVRIMVRDQKRVAGREWEKSVEIAVGDLTDIHSLKYALEGIDVAYYLVHSMSTGYDFVKQDRQMALSFVHVGGHLKHVIYLGGLLPHAHIVSRHLKSRAEVGEILMSGLPVTELRAGPIIGSGSASFEMVRYLVQRLPVIVAPNWILHEVQPIAIRDILSYLILALERKPLGVVDIGSDQITFKQMMEVYAEVRGLRQRWICTVPPLLPIKLAARWIALLTPIPNRLAISLVESIVHPVLAHTENAKKAFPEVNPIPYHQAVELALLRIQEQAVETRWSGAFGNLPRYRMLEDREGLIREVRIVNTNLPPDALFRSFSSIGGDRGWLNWKWIWEIRGFIDKLVGGPGLRRGRRHPTELLVGEALDFWRVEAIEPPHLLRLYAEMKVPGQAWMQWEAIQEGSGSRLVQTAMFAPRGFWGVMYWYCLYPIHTVIFSDLVRALARDAKNMQ